AETILKKQLGEDHYLLANCKYQIGTFLLISHSKMALKYFKEASAIYQKVYGEIYPNRVQIEKLLGATYGLLKNYEEAIKHIELGIEMEKKHFANNPVTIAVLEHNLADQYLLSNKDILLAKHYYEKSLPIMKESQGPGIYYHWMRLHYAKTLGLLGENTIAEQYLRDSMEFFEQVKKENKSGYLSLARSKIYLAEILKKNEQHCEIRTLLSEALPDFKFEIGDDHDTYRETQENLRITHLKIEENNLSCQKHI
ncbi:MAG: tetratricopeptide repeat protein, partial [Alcanivoracaceae bacterium]|nr:tetratricopeptide repeat protein [Alcanivoracaceae bacterium]